MNYQGRIFGKVRNEYFELEMTTQDVEALQAENEKLKKGNQIPVEPCVFSPEIDLKEGTAIIVKTSEMHFHISAQEGALCIKDIENCSTQLLVEPVLSTEVTH